MLLRCADSWSVVLSRVFDVFFFFSSRRRHTRFDCDWSSDVCSSDLWHDSTPLPWNAEIERFFAAVKKFDDFLASGEPVHGSVEGIFQGPVADALNHVGQIAMLRRLAGSPILGENYFRAEIAAGRVGPEQSAPRREFE